MEKEELYIPQTSRHTDGKLMTDKKTVVEEKKPEDIIKQVKEAHAAGKEKEPVAAVPADEPKSKASK